MSFSFTPQNLERFEALKPRYPELRALTLPALWMAQQQEGHISPEAIGYIAKLTEHSPAEIYAIASFYTMFSFAPRGTYHIEVCQTLSCALCGKDVLLKHLKERLGIAPGETSADGRFTLSVVECMGACGGAPMIALNETYHESLTPEALDTILEALA